VFRKVRVDGGAEDTYPAGRIFDDPEELDSPSGACHQPTNKHAQLHHI
jgi:hypothetical protein